MDSKLEWPCHERSLQFQHFFFCYETRKPASRVFLAPPEGLMQLLSSLNHAQQLLLAKFFDLMKLEFWPPGPPEPPGGQGSNLNSLFPALQHEGHTLSIWFGYYERFPRSFATHVFTDKAKSTSKYLLDWQKNNGYQFFINSLTNVHEKAPIPMESIFSCRTKSPQAALETTNFISHHHDWTFHWAAQLKVCCIVRYQKGWKEANS